MYFISKRGPNSDISHIWKANRIFIFHIILNLLNWVLPLECLWISYIPSFSKINSSERGQQKQFQNFNVSILHPVLMQNGHSSMGYWWTINKILQTKIPNIWKVYRIFISHPMLMQFFFELIATIASGRLVVFRRISKFRNFPYLTWNSKTRKRFKSLV